MQAKFVSPILMWLIAFAGIAAILLLAPPLTIFERNTPASFAFAIILITYLGFFSITLLPNRHASSSAAGIKKLITTGLYSIVRHPIYFADMLMSWGVFLLFPYLASLLCAIWVNAVLLYWMGLEENALRKKFGRKYSDYEKKVPKLVPRTI